MKRWSVFVLSVMFLLVASSSFAYSYLGAVESYDVINGVPLEIAVGEKGTLGVTVNDTAQYFAGDCWGSILFVEYGNIALQQKFISTYFSSWHGDSSPVFTPVSIEQVSDYEIDVVFDAAESGIRISQNIVYEDGERYYRKTWNISNIGETTYSNLRFFHGGDTTFGGIDSSNGHYDDILNMVYLTNPDPSVDGIMGFYAHPNSPANHYQEGNYSTVSGNMLLGSLPDSVNTEYHDAGYGLQWNRSSLAPGETWTIEAFEKWTEAGFVQVIAPAGESASAGTDLIYNFLVQNMDEDPASFDLAAQSSNGWTVSVDPSTVNIPGGASELVDVTLSFPGDALHGTTDTLELTATSQADPGVTNSDSVTSTVDNGGDDDDDIVGDDDDDSDKVGDGSGCNVGTFSPSLLLLLAPILFFIKK